MPEPNPSVPPMTIETPPATPKAEGGTPVTLPVPTNIAPPTETGVAPQDVDPFPLEKSEAWTPSGVETPSEQQVIQAEPALPQQLVALARQYGMPDGQFAHFSDLASANQAASMLVNSYATSGLSAPQALVPVTPEAPTAADPASVEFPYELDPEAVDAKTIAAIKGVHSDNQKLAQKLQATESRMQSMNDERVAEDQAVLQREAVSALDGMNDPRYGTTATRTPAQMLAGDRLFELVNVISRGMTANGASKPPMTALLAQAAMLDAQQMGYVAPQPAQVQQAPAPVVPTPAFYPTPQPTPQSTGVPGQTYNPAYQVPSVVPAGAVQAAPARADTSVPAVRTDAMIGQFSRDDTFMQQVRARLARQ